MTVNPVPRGYHTVTANVVVDNAERVIEFAKQAFDAKQRMRFDAPDGSIAHAEIQIGDSIIMVADASEEFPPRPAILLLYVPNVDATYAQALRSGAISLREPVNAFYGDRSAGVLDGVGNQWWIATHIEDVSLDEMHRRAEKLHSALAT
jgi:uncharacterized glyoxalase superfamily protein PhnB